MNILVFAEVRDGSLKKSSLETLSEAARIAQKLGGKVAAVLVGEGVRAHSDTLGKHGAAQVYVVDSPRLKYYAAEAYAKAVGEAHKKFGSGAVFMAATAMGRDVSAGVGALLGTSAATDCTAVTAEGRALTAIRPVYAGKAYVTVAFKKSPAAHAVQPDR